jgi:hypothetical protein
MLFFSIPLNLSIYPSKQFYEKLFPMNHQMAIKALESNAATFKAMLSGVPKEIYLWKPAPDKWSLLEIICHLYDEEREDFRARLKSTLLSPEQPWPPIDPLKWVVERKYPEQDYENKIMAFLNERADSIRWLGSLVNPDWNNSYVHPKVGPVKAELLLANWLAHDYLHFRQITRTKYLYLREHAGVPLDYAGIW